MSSNCFCSLSVATENVYFGRNRNYVLSIYSSFLFTEIQFLLILLKRFAVAHCKEVNIECRISEQSLSTCILLLSARTAT